MFYESERIVRKQFIFINAKATEMVDKFKSRGLSSDETIAALELLLEDKSATETHIDIVNRAIAVLKRG